MKILVVEDDQKTADYISRGLNEAGHVCDVMRDGTDALFQVTREQYDVLVIDRMIPGLDGLSLIKAARAAKIRTPAMFLTPASGVDDRVEGLEAGGDDYLTKPFAFSELLARLNALARRPPVQDTQTVLRAFDIEMDLLSRSVTRGGRQVDLQPREFGLLEFLLRNVDRVVTRKMLLEGVWEFHFDPKTNIVETHMSRLRTKLSQGGLPNLITTIRGVGYMIR